MTSKDFCLSRPTTRVHAAPGGRSQISFGDYEAPKQVEKENVVAPVAKKVEEIAPKVGAAPAPVAAAPAVAPQSQHTSVRVRQAPGGASSFSLGW